MWEKATNTDGFNGTITYTVEVFDCEAEPKCNTTAKDVQILPSKTNLTTTYVTISKLVLTRTYKIKVISMNNLKNVPMNKWKFAETEFPLAGLYYERLFEKPSLMKTVLYQVRSKREFKRYSY